MERDLSSHPRRLDRWRARSWAGWREAGSFWLAIGIALVAIFFGMGCTPQVGDSCQLSTDCGTTGNLVCDTSQFEGYCTLLDCVPEQCPNDAACVLFNASEPGCGYDDRTQGSPLSQQLCMKTCSSNSDCRLGYVCASPVVTPWSGMVLDSKSYELVCLPLPPNGQIGGDSGPIVDPDSAVCQLLGPTFDAYPPPPDALGN
jgi:hypothetical protein